MSDWYAHLDEVDDIDENKSSQISLTRYDAIILLIDASTSMRDKNADGQSPLQQAFAVTADILKQKAIGSNSDQVAVVIYDCARKRNANAFSRIFVLHELRVPNANIIQKLTRAGSEQSHFDALIHELEDDSLPEPNSPLDLYKCFWLCSMLFSGSKKTRERWSMRVFILTDNDSPSSSSGRSTLQDCRPKVRALAELGASVDVYGLSSRTHPTFDSQKFFAHLHTVDNKLNEEKQKSFVTVTSLHSEVSDLYHLRKKIRCKVFPRRTLAKVLFSLSPNDADLTVAVRLYTVFQIAQKPSAQYMDALGARNAAEAANDVQQDDLTPLVHSSVLIAGGDMILEDYQVRTFVPYADEKVSLSKDDVKQLQMMSSGDDQSIRHSDIILLGFKPRNALRCFDAIRPAILIRPDEARVQGSGAALYALSETLQADGMMAIVSLTLRHASTPRIAALLPCCGRDDSDDGHGNAAFYAMLLPYVEDLRDVPLKRSETFSVKNIDETLIDMAVSIVMSSDDTDVKSESLQEIDNPELAKFYVALQTLGLDEDTPENVEDNLVPRVKFDESLLQLFSRTVNDEYSQQTEQNITTLHGSKRKFDAAEKIVAKKTKKILMTEQEEIDYEAMAKGNLLSLLTMKQLREFLSSNHLKVGGKKSMLIARIDAFIFSKTT